MHAPLAFMNLGGQEMLVIFVIILLLFGAKKIPELARGLGKSMGEFKKARDEFEREIHSAADEASADKEETKIKEVSGKEPREI